jgi:hypothetical protein
MHGREPIANFLSPFVIASADHHLRAGADKQLSRCFANA